MEVDPGEFEEIGLVSLKRGDSSETTGPMERSHWSNKLDPGSQHAQAGYGLLSVGTSLNTIRTGYHKQKICCIFE